MHYNAEKAAEKSLFCSVHQTLKTAVKVSVLGVVIGVAVTTLTSPSAPSHHGDPALIAASGSVTACIEQTAIANEIEITRSSIERATRKVSGFSLDAMPEDEESPEACSLKLA